ncbi:MAG TPA: carboxypeptidase-like regulatory domain-containing protein [Thermoanaerobaculia bacterium]|nr:carboxypeptidase-like regulatory domain-containing protein [Thermoanaerobaculia bacterium]
MRRFQVAAVAVLLTVAGSTPARADAPLAGAFEVLGNVTNAARPVANALVIALDLTSFEATQTFTGADGRFSLPALRSGIYKIIAVKTGFAPAITTIMPAKDQRVTLRLQSEKKARQNDDQIWEIRGSLPPDVLREIDMILEPAAQKAAYEVPRLKAEMLSMTGMTAARQADGPAFAQTGIGVQSRIGDNWQLGIRGDMQRFDDPTDNQTFGEPVAASSAMSMELRSSPTDSFKFNSTRSTWRYNDAAVADQPADLRSHNVEWEHGDARVKVRYFAHENLFRPAFGSDVIEVAGDTTLVQTRRNDIGVSLRVRQESVRANNSDTLRTADIAANGTVELVPAVIVHYGMASRLALDRAEWAPSTGLEWKFTKNTALIGSAAYKVLDSSPAAHLLPSLVILADDGQVLPRYSYSVGVVSSRDENNRLSMVATITAADSPLRLIISDGTQQFWDSLAVDQGDIQRDVRVAYRHDFGSRFAIDVATAAGTATPRGFSGDPQKTYLTGDLQTIFTPTRTMLAVSYRGIEQPAPAAHEQYRSSRVNVRMSQSLYLPIDMKLLVGVELVRAQNSPFLLDTLLPEETSRKYIGGLAVNF